MCECGCEVCRRGGTDGTSEVVAGLVLVRTGVCFSTVGWGLGVGCLSSHGVSRDGQSKVRKERVKKVKKKPELGRQKGREEKIEEGSQETNRTKRPAKCGSWELGWYVPL